MSVPKGTRIGGRQKGTRNKRTEAQASDVLNSGLTPLDYMLTVLRDPTQKYEIRLDAAKAAAPYVHPKLANIEVTGRDGGPLEVRVVQFSNPAQPVGAKALPDALVERAGGRLPAGSSR